MSSVYINCNNREVIPSGFSIYTYNNIYNGMSGRMCRRNGLELNPCHLHIEFVELVKLVELVEAIYRKNRLMSRSLLGIRPLVEVNNLELNPCHFYIELID